MQVPTENINICFVGGVSTGKSTILNAIFCEEYTQCKIKRTTMIPTVYVENDTTSSFVQTPEEILQIVSQKNKDLIEKTEKNIETDIKEYDELVFQVGKLDINIVENAYVNVYDIPGLNDARTKEIYYNYLEKNFNSFNIVVFIVDLHSGMNTNDEIDILNFITKNTKYHNDKNQKIHHLVIVNKADDMQVDESSGDLIITGELKEMYEQVEKTVISQYERLEIKDQLIGIMPLCAIDAYLYRMVQKHGTSFKLSQEQILKIGINEHGKKFSTWKPAVQEQKVYECLEDTEFIQTMIQLSGFSLLEKYLKTFLEKQSVPIRVNNILQEMKKLPDFSKELDVSNLNATGVLGKFYELYEKMKLIDGELYQEKIIAFAEKIKKTVEKQMREFSNIVNLIDAYDLFVEMVDSVHFEDLFNYLELNTYPESIQTHAMDLIIKEIMSGGYTLFKFAASINRLKHIDAFTQKNVKEIISCVINEVFHNNILIGVNISTDILIPILEEIKMVLNVDILVFIRWILYTRYKTLSTTNESLLYIAKLHFQKNQDYQMINLLDSIILTDCHINAKIYIGDVDAAFYKNDEKLSLEKYYTNITQKDRNEPEAKMSPEANVKHLEVSSGLIEKTEECKYELKYLKLKIDYELLMEKVEKLEKMHEIECHRLLTKVEQLDYAHEVDCDALFKIVEKLEKAQEINGNSYIVSPTWLKKSGGLGYNFCEHMTIENNCNIQIDSAGGGELRLKITNVNQTEKIISLPPYLFNCMKPITANVNIEIINIYAFINGYVNYAEQAFMHLFNIFPNIIYFKMNDTTKDLLMRFNTICNSNSGFCNGYFDLPLITTNFPTHKINKKSEQLTEDELFDFINNKIKKN